jgi:hypothetical protein
MSSNTMQQHQEKDKPKGMQFVSRMTQMGNYFYLRIPKERNATAKKYFDNKKYLLVNFTEVEVREK